MKKILLGLVAVSSLAFSGCNSCSQSWSHIKSGTIGINRTVTFYSANGGVIKSWDVTSTVEDRGGSFRFMYHGKAITVSGNVLMEEK